jgi:hypothetical protein
MQFEHFKSPAQAPLIQWPYQDQWRQSPAGNLPVSLEAVSRAFGLEQYNLVEQGDELTTLM